MNRLDDIVAAVFRSEIESGVDMVRRALARASTAVNAVSLQGDATRLLRERLKEIATGALLGYGFRRKLCESEPLICALERAVAQDSGASFREEFPELLRCINVVCRNFISQLISIISRFKNDQCEIDTVLSGNTQQLQSIIAVMSDHHEAQSCVFLVAVGEKYLIYKNKPLDADVIFHSVLGKMAANNPRLDLPAIAIVNKGRYGWMEFVNHKPCVDLQEVSQFYLRCGYLLSILVMLRSSDHHCDNLIASGGYPFFVDLECSFIPSLILDKRSPARMSMNSIGVVSHVDRIGEFEFDRGAFAWRTGALALALTWRGWGTGGSPELDYEKRIVSQSPNNPHSAESILESRQFRRFLVTGYREGRRILRGIKSELTAYLVSVHDDPMRLVLRSTRFYKELLAFSFSPSLCKSTTCRRAFLKGFLQEDDPRLGPLVNEEIESLMDGEIPHFQHLPGHRIVSANGQRFEGVIRTPGLDLVLRDFPRPVNHSERSLETAAV